MPASTPPSPHPRLLHSGGGGGAAPSCADLVPLLLRLVAAGTGPLYQGTVTWALDATFPSDGGVTVVNGVPHVAGSCLGHPELLTKEACLSFGSCRCGDTGV
jgi:hypothetical protein